MPTDELNRLLEQKLSVAFEEREQSLIREYAKRISLFNGKGMLQSSASARSILELYTHEFVIRANTTLYQCKRIASALGTEYSSDLPEMIKATISDVVSQEARSLCSKVRDSVPFKDTDGYGAQPDNEFENVVDRVVRDMNTEIELWMSILRRSSENVQNGGTNVHIAGNVGIMQTGDYATASQTIVLDAEGKDLLTQALREVSEAIEADTEILANSDEVKELIADSQSELQKECPNQTKLKATLTAITQSIQTAAAMGPAYQTLKGALALIGIPLP